MTLPRGMKSTQSQLSVRRSGAGKTLRAIHNSATMRLMLVLKQEFIIPECKRTSGTSVSTLRKVLSGT